MEEREVEEEANEERGKEQDGEVGNLRPKWKNRMHHLQDIVDELVFVCVGDASELGVH